MKPIEDKERYTLSKIVRDNLREYIMSNNLSTGDKLPSERDLASMLDVSRVIIREALHSLEASGILTIKHGEGAFVNADDSSTIFNNLLFFWQMKDKKIEELFELRLLLEKTAIEHLIAKTNSDHLVELENNIKLMSETEDLEKFKEYDIEFHRGLISATKNELFSQLVDIIVQYFSNVSPSNLTQHDKDQTIQEHTLIIEALKDKDEQLALKLLDVHLQRSKTLTPLMVKKLDSS
ncbi:FadR/GntR family transcriptional regulator [Peribacillus butanolivorans]|uniref:FadR/GntR family transcriptional regulator n=1 Tax=Peribacillus butanolivorans TaxID=421767 RepID=UPI003646B05B